MSHLILAKMVQVYHAKKGVAFDCSGRFWGKTIKLLQGPDLTNRPVGVLSSFTKNQSHSWATLICSIKSRCLKTLQRDFLRFLCWSRWNLKIGFLISTIPMKYRKIRFSQTLPGWRPWLTCSKTVPFKLLSILFFFQTFPIFYFFQIQRNKPFSFPPRVG